MSRVFQKLAVVLTVLLAACTPTVTLTPAPTPTAAPKVGQPIKGSGGAVYRLMADGSIRHLPNWATFLAWGYAPGDILELPPEALAAYKLGAPLTRFVTGINDTSLYAVFNGARYPLTAAPQGIEAFPLQVSQVPDDVLASLPLGKGQYPQPISFSDDPAAITAAALHNDEIWIADEAGMIRRFNIQTGQWTVSQWAGGGQITVLHASGDALYAGTSTGTVLQLDPPAAEPLIQSSGWISAISGGEQGYPRAANRGYYDLKNSAYQKGWGIINVVQ